MFLWKLLTAKFGKSVRSVICRTQSECYEASFHEFVNSLFQTNTLPTILMILHTRRKATPARNLLQFKVPTFLLWKVRCDCSILFHKYRYFRPKNSPCLLCSIFDRSFQQTQKMFFCVDSAELTLLPFWNGHDDWRNWNYSLRDPQLPELHGHRHAAGLFNSPFVAEVPWVSSRETKENVFWQTLLAKSDVFCHRRDNYSHIYKNIGMAKRSE